MSIHGNRSLQNNFLLDGVDNNSISTNVQELSTQVSRPFRDETFDSRTYFAERSGLDKPANNQNQFGFNTGGPLVRNRAFLFGDFEATRITQGVLRAGRVATAEERSGVFGSTVRDPLTGLPFPNNTIPADRLDPVARNIMNLVPLPNTTRTNNYIRQPTSTMTVNAI